MDFEGSSREHLRAFIERIERLEEEKKAIADDIREVFAEAKTMGFDLKAIRSILRMRKQEPHVREEEEAVLTTYMAALGMLPDSEDWPLTSGAVS